MTTPLHEINEAVWALAYGLLGDRELVAAVFLVAYEGFTYQAAAEKTGKPASTIRRSRARFCERMEMYRLGMSPN